MMDCRHRQCVGSFLRFASAFTLDAPDEARQPRKSCQGYESNDCAQHELGLDFLKFRGFERLRGHAGSDLRCGKQPSYVERRSAIGFRRVCPRGSIKSSSFDELRFWVRASPTADGARTRPFFLGFSYVDQNDGPGEVHEWFVVVNRQNAWEQRRIGVENERRSAINRLRFTCLSNAPFACNIDEFLAVHEEMLADVEQALLARLEQQLALPGLANIAIDQNAAQGTTQVRLPLTQGFNAGNRILIQGGSARQ